MVHNAAIRRDKPDSLRLLQVDFAARDDNAPTGWVFGTFMYDGSQKDDEVGLIKRVVRDL
jgi:hypothetical protein